MQIPRRSLRRLLSYPLLIALTVAGWQYSQAAEKTEKSTVEANSAVEERLTDEIRFIASDELEGRGIGTQGIDKAAEFIAKKYADLGLKTDIFNGTPFQKFKVTTTSELGPKEQNRLELVGPADEKGNPQVIELKLDAEFTPLALSGSGKFDLPLVFVGYGITTHKEKGEDKAKYDDYAGLDVKGKAVLILRHTPDQANPHGNFQGGQHPDYAPIVRKVSNAYEHGAAAVLFCTDNFDAQKNFKAQQKKWQDAIEQLAKAEAEYKKVEKSNQEQFEKHRKHIEELAAKITEAGKELPALYDPAYGFQGGSPAGEGGRDLPVLHCLRTPLEGVVKAALHTDLAAIEKEIDQGAGNPAGGPKPQSRELTGWRIRGETNVARKEVEVKNIVAVLEGEGPHADETLIIGAHYDHLGRGGSGSLAPGSTEIHHGADDNGSGTVALLEVARMLAAREKKLPRRVVFISFTGEERGLLGSARYVKEPAFPLDKTIAMLNMDMVGRLADDKLIIYGTGTAKEFDSLVDRYGEKYGFHVKKDPAGFGPSDHASFYAKQIPVLHYFTGTHKDYHRPTDVAEKINVAGMRRVLDMVAEMAVEIAEAESPPVYVQVKGTAQIKPSGSRPYFGSIPDFSQDDPGYAITGVSKDGPADKAGLKGGDIIIQFGESKIGNLDDFDNALRKYKAGDKVPLVIRRGQEEKKLEVVLDAPRE